MRSLTREEGEALLDRQKSRPVGRAARRTAPTPKERDIQRAILAFLATVPGVVAWRTNSGAAMLPGHGGKGQHVRFGFKGLSDIVGWHRYWATCQGGMAMPSCEGVARFLAIEVKTAKTYPTAEQQAFLDQVKAAGGIAVCARSVHDVALALGLAERGSTRQREADDRRGR